MLLLLLLLSLMMLLLLLLLLLQVAVFPLVNNKPEITELAKSLFAKLKMR